MIQRGGQPAEGGEWWQILPAVVQSVFWLTVGTVAVLTYIHARKTVLQPLRTEFFKHQMQELAEVLREFMGSNEHLLRGRSGLHQAYVANVAALLDGYASVWFDRKTTDPEERPYSLKYCPSSMLRPKHLELADGDTTDDPAPPRKRDTRETREKWHQEYEYANVRIPREVNKFRENLEKYTQNPFLPPACAFAIRSLDEAIQFNLLTLGDTLTECGRELPSRYPTFEKMSKLSDDWIWNRWNSRIRPLDPLVEEIIRSAREHLASDEFPGLQGVHPAKVRSKR